MKKQVHAIKFREGSERSLMRKRKREFYESQIHKLPNEMKGAFTDYNSNSCGGNFQIDENNYYFE